MVQSLGESWSRPPPQATVVRIGRADRTGIAGTWEATGAYVHRRPYHHLSYLQAMDEPGMSLLDQSVIKKGKEWRASARAEAGKMV